MQDKLKQLTEKLYSEGIEAGQSQAEHILSEAKKKADKIVEDAQIKAKETLKKADEESSLKHKQTMSELKLASQKAVSKIRQDISNMLSDKLFNESVDKTMKDDEFVKKMILTILEAWSSKSGEEMNIKVYLSKIKESEMKKFITTKCKSFMDKGCEIIFDEDLSFGFKIGPKDGSYSVEFSDESFKSLFKNYLRQDVQKIIFAK